MIYRLKTILLMVQVSQPCKLLWIPRHRSQRLLQRSGPGARQKRGPCFCHPPISSELSLHNLDWTCLNIYIYIYIYMLYVDYILIYSILCCICVIERYQKHQICASSMARLNGDITSCQAALHRSKQGGKMDDITCASWLFCSQLGGFKFNKADVYRCISYIATLQL